MDISKKSNRKLCFALKQADQRGCWIKTPIITAVLVCVDVSSVEGVYHISDSGSGDANSDGNF
jgi:hypothetical protein